ncbi:MAG: MoaD/ThiS family protein [Anaerolineaceae bacterium]|nr:MoaD/ThiS family protein [Anaerolineaceae bacterium]
MKIKVSLYYHLKEKAGTGSLELEVENLSTIKDLKMLLEEKYPSLRTQLDNVMMLIDGKIVLNEDQLKENATVSFLTPVGGG